MILLLSSLLLLSSIAPSNGADGRTEKVGLPNQMKLHKADIFQHKCHSLLYRSILVEDVCYFAINKNISFDVAQANCENVLAGSVFHTDKGATGLLALMLLKGDDYHSSTSQGSGKGVLCKHVNPFSCKPEERREMRGRCVTSFDVKKNFKEAAKHCYERNSHLPWINNDEENSAIASIVTQSSSPNSYWVDQTAVGAKWRAASSNPVQYFYWLFGKTAFPLTIKCAAETAVAVNAKVPVSGCVAYAKWQPTLQTELRQVVCVRPSDSDFSPKIVPPTAAAMVVHKNNPPLAAWTWTLKYYYNYGRILHGFCSDNAGCRTVFNNGIGYSGSAGSGALGRTITRAGMLRMPEVCSEGYTKLKPLSFKMQGHAWVHNFGNQGVFAGYVALKKGVCGAKIDMWGYSCAFSGDAMYAQNLEWNTFYKGRRWGAIAFVLW